MDPARPPTGRQQTTQGHTQFATLELDRIVRGRAMRWRRMGADVGEDEDEAVRRIGVAPRDTTSGMGAISALARV
jgi:hypothetical protein